MCVCVEQQKGEIIRKHSFYLSPISLFFSTLIFFSFPPMDSTLTKNDTKDDMSDEESRRFSTCSSPSSSSFYKMSVDSDDARSTSSSKSFHKPYSTTTTRDEVLFMDPISRPSNNNNNRRSYDFRERPERRSVNRRSSLLVTFVKPHRVFFLFSYNNNNSQNQKHY